MIKKFIVSISLLFSVVLVAQQGTSSPYSFYGIGEVRFRVTIENRSMSGLSIIPDSIHLNIENPAMYSSLRLTTYALGGNVSVNKLSSDSQTEKAKRTTLDYLAVGLPLKRIGVGFGLIPYSSVGYNVGNSVTDGSGFRTDNYYSGDGGINKVFLGLGFKISKKLSFGADAQYNFGKINTKTISMQYMPDGTQIQYGTREINSSQVRGVNFNMGLSYQSKLNKKISLFSSLTYSPEANLYLSNGRTLALIQAFSGTVESVLGDVVDVPVDNTILKLPSKFTFGIGIGEVKKWIIGTQITKQGTSSFGSRFNDVTTVRYENSTRFVLGGYYIPNYKSYNNFFNKVVYRGGFRYENTGLIINDQSIKDAALTLGLGLPLRGTFSNVNFGFELGNRGTQSAGLVKENYMNFSIGLSLNDQWFIKRKYN
ncbi:MAG: hypothetical protein WCJ62_03955 [Flavobacterium sp.]